MNRLTRLESDQTLTIIAKATKIAASKVPVMAPHTRPEPSTGCPWDRTATYGMVRTRAAGQGDEQPEGEGGGQRHHDPLFQRQQMQLVVRAEQEGRERHQQAEEDEEVQRPAAP